VIAGLKFGQRARNAARIGAALPRAWRIVLDAAARPSFALIAVTLFAGLLPIALLALTKPTVDALSAWLANPRELSWQGPVLYVALVAVVLLVTEVVTALMAWLRLNQSELVSAHVRELTQAQSSRVAMGFYERPEFFDQLHRARDAAAERPAEVIEGMTELGRAGIALLGVTLILASYIWWLPLLLLLAMLPALFNALLQAWRQHRFELLMTVEERHADYFDWLLTSRNAAAEVRAFGLSQHFRRRYAEVRALIRRGRLRLLARESAMQVGLAGVGLLAAGAAVVWMLTRAAGGEATLGDAALCYQGFVQGSALTRGAVGSLATVYRSSLFLDDFFRFLELPGDPLEERSGGTESAATDRASAAPSIQPSDAPRLQFENVSFSYGDGRVRALEDLNLIIEPGQLLAVLGPNGAGKSTLVKLLCRFYDPDQGRLLIDGVDARDLPVADVRKRFSVMFQSALSLSGTLAENVAPLASADVERIESALRAAAAEGLVASLPDGLQTRLASWFPGGTELSGGEWQRIAMARSFARDASVLVLDEPTSAMDPWAERQWLATLRQSAAGRTVILITHRLTTASIADVIHVMDQGRVIESGDHASLCRQGGAYARLWGVEAGGTLDSS